MASWFDLPSEVKQMIFSMISEVDSIIYVPRDRRKKVDLRYLEAHHFHDLLLVSKKFITSEEFAFAILNSAKLRFYSDNELRRLMTEVPRSFKDNIRRIEFSRTHPMEDFKNLSNIETTLSNEMPRLRQIYVSWPDHCAQIARWMIPDTDQIEEETQSNVVEHILSDRPSGDIQTVQMEYTNSLSHVAASFIGNRDSWCRGYSWTRPISWIRRLILYAEESNIEVILRIRICFMCVFPFQIPSESLPAGIFECWSASKLRYWKPRWQLHLDGEMSSKDFIFRVEYDGRKYAFHQKLAYDLMHAPNNRGRQYWRNMVAASLGFTSRDGF